MLALSLLLAAGCTSGSQRQTGCPAPKDLSQGTYTEYALSADPGQMKMAEVPETEIISWIVKNSRTGLSGESVQPKSAEAKDVAEALNGKGFSVQTGKGEEGLVSAAVQNFIKAGTPKPVMAKVPALLFDSDKKEEWTWVLISGVSTDEAGEIAAITLTAPEFEYPDTQNVFTVNQDFSYIKCLLREMGKLPYVDVIY